MVLIIGIAAGVILCLIISLLAVFIILASNMTPPWDEDLYADRYEEHQEQGLILKTESYSGLMGYGNHNQDVVKLLQYDSSISEPLA